MAQDITIAGASYEGVPGIDIPKTGGGVARFEDTTEARAALREWLTGEGVTVPEGATLDELVGLVVTPRGGETVTLTPTITNYQGNAATSNTYVGNSNSTASRSRIAFTPEEKLASVTVTISYKVTAYGTKTLSYGVDTVGNINSLPGAWTDWATITTGNHGKSYTESFTITQDFSAGTTYYIWLRATPTSGNYAYIKHNNDITMSGVTA